MNFILRPRTAIAAAMLLALASPAAALPPPTRKQEANRKVVLEFYEKGLNQKDADAAIAHDGQPLRPAQSERGRRP